MSIPIMPKKTIQTTTGMASEATQSRTEIESRASQWLAQRDSGRWTRADEEQLNQWLNESAGHMVAFLRFEEAWNATRRLKALGTQTADEEQWADQRRATPRPLVADSDPGRGRYFAVAASLLVAIGAGAYALKLGLPSGTGYATPLGGIATVPMNDGSKITLNTNSQIRVAVTDAERRIDLKQGEAFFEVAKDPKRPFFVEVDGKRVVAVGTKFSVRHDSGDLEVVVTEGRVRIEGLSGGAPSAQLTAGNVAYAGANSILVQEKPLAEVEERLSWRTGYVVFHMTPLAAAVAEFNRYNARKIVIADPEVAAVRIGGNFRTDNVDSFVRLLQDGFSIKSTQHDAQIVLTKN